MDKEPPKAHRREAAMGSDSSALAPTEKGGGGEKGEGGAGTERGKASCWGPWLEWRFPPRFITTEECATRADPVFSLQPGEVLVLQPSSSRP